MTVTLRGGSRSFGGIVEALAGVRDAFGRKTPPLGMSVLVTSRFHGNGGPRAIRSRRNGEPTSGGVMGGRSRGDDAGGTRRAGVGSFAMAPPPTPRVAYRPPGRLPMTVSILHISDIHAGPAQLTDVDEKEHLTDSVRRGFLDRLTAYVKELGKVPDLVAVT